MKEPEIVYEIEAENGIDPKAIHEKVQEICEAYKNYKLRIVVREKTETISGW